MAKEFTVRFWGVRGSVASGGRQFSRIGGNTSCVEVRAHDELIILDAGTGLFPLGQTLGSNVRATFLFSHFHWDHIQGFPLFRPAYDPTNTFTLYGPGEDGIELMAALAGQMQAPHFPVGLDALAAQLEFRSIGPDDEVQIGPVRIHAAALNHPQGCLGYRISVGDASFVYATDTEQRDPGIDDQNVLGLIDGADLLVYDAQYTEGEYTGRSGPSRRGWGHSTVDEACRLARVANVRQLALFHHDPTHDDRMMARLVREAHQLFPNVVAAREGMTLRLPQPAKRPRRHRLNAPRFPMPAGREATEGADLVCAPSAAPQR